MTNIMRIFTVIMAVLFTFAACDGDPSPQPTPVDSDTVTTLDTTNTDVTTLDTTTQPTGCENFPWLSEKIGQHMSCDVNGTPVDCKLTVREEDGQCAAECPPTFSELASDLIPTTDGGFSLVDDIGALKCVEFIEPVLECPTKVQTWLCPQGFNDPVECTTSDWSTIEYKGDDYCFAPCVGAGNFQFPLQEDGPDGGPMTLFEGLCTLIE